MQLSALRELTVNVDFSDIDISNLTRIDSAMDAIEDNFNRLDDSIGGADREFGRLGRAGSDAMDDVRSETNRADAAINALDNSIDAADRELNDLGDNSAMDEVRRDADRASDSVDDLTNSANRVERSVRGIDSGFGSLGHTIRKTAELMGLLYVVDKVKDGVTELVKGGLGFNATMETSNQAWEVIVGSAEKAKATTQELLKLGADTPFEFEGLDKAGKTLTMASLGGKNLTSNLTKVGDAVSAIGGGQDVLEGVATALFQMQAKGKVQAEEMMQLAERGLPVWDLLAKKMGKSTAQLMDMSSKGKLLAKDVVPMLVDAMGERFKGSMEKQAKTYNGMISTLADNWKMMAGALMQPTFEKLQGALPLVIDLIGDFTEGMQQTGSVMGGLSRIMPHKEFMQFKKAVGYVKDIFGDLYSIAGDVFGYFGDGKGIVDNLVGALGALRDVVHFVSDNTSILIPLLGGVFAAMGALRIISTVQALWAAYSATTFATTLAQEGLNVALTANPIGLIITAIGLLVAAGIYLYKNWDMVKGKTIELWNKLGAFKGVVTAMLGPFGFLIRAAVTIADNWDNTKGVWENVWNGIKIAASNAVNDVLGSINALIKQINKIPGVEIPLIPKVNWGKNKDYKDAAPKAISGNIGAPQMMSHATGLYSVPYDNYPANLHKDEAVLTAQQSNALRELGILNRGQGVKPKVDLSNGISRSGGGGGNTTFAPQVTIQINGSTENPQEVANLAAEAARKEMQKFWEEMNMKTA